MGKEQENTTCQKNSPHSEKSWHDLRINISCCFEGCKCEEVDCSWWFHQIKQGFCDVLCHLYSVKAYST